MGESNDRRLRGEGPSSPSDLPDALDTEKMVVVGSFGAPHGVHGELRIFEADLRSPAFEEGQSLWVRMRNGWEHLTVVQVRETPKHGIGEFAEIQGRDEAARFRNEDIYIPVEALPDRADGEFYQAELQGRSVHMALSPSEDGEVGDVRRIGEVGGFFETNGANDVMVVLLGSGEELLVPMIEGAVAPVEADSDRIVVYHPSQWGPDGLDVPPEAPAGSG